MSPPSEPSPQALFSVSGLRFSYPSAPGEPGPMVLDEASFSLAAGERVALTGPNGAGKTTLLLLLVGLLRPHAGCIEAFGSICQREADFRVVRARAGLLFQDPDDQLFCPTVAEDVAFGPLNLGCDRQTVRQRVAETLAMLGLDGYADRITHKLSGGEKRLVSLASVLAMQPDVLLLDEPTNALDTPTQERLLDILDNLPQAMILISHDRSFRSALATRSLSLQAGHLVPVDEGDRSDRY